MSAMAVLLPARTIFPAPLNPRHTGRCFFGKPRKGYNRLPHPLSAKAGPPLTTRLENGGNLLQHEPDHQEFPMWTSVRRIVRFSRPRHNEFATRAGPGRDHDVLAARSR